MNNIKDLTKAELLEYNKKLVLALLNKQGYDISKIKAGRTKTKYKISQTCNIKISGYRYNEKVSGNYTYILKKDFDIENEKYLFFVLYIKNNAHILKIPSQVFINPAPNSAFKNRDYTGKKSLPEYGIVMNKNTLDELLQYEENILQ